MILTLKGLTNHGKNRIREHGDQWEVLDLPPGVIRQSQKPAFPAIKSLKTGEWRWLDEINFEIRLESSTQRVRFFLTLANTHAIILI